MFSSLLVLSLFVIVCNARSFGAHEQRATVGKSYGEKVGYASLGKATNDEDLNSSPLMRIRILLRLEASHLKRVEMEANDLSDPKSKRYGKWHTRETLKAFIVDDLLRERHDTVLQWLRSHDISGEDEVLLNGDSITVLSHSHKLERAFNCEIHRFVHKAAPKRVLLRSANDISMPASVAKHVHFIVGLTDFWRASKHNNHGDRLMEIAAPGYNINNNNLKRNSIALNRNTGKHEPRVADVKANMFDLRSGRCSNCSQMTPDSLKSYYNVSKTLQGFGFASNITQAVGAFAETYSPKALKMFGQKVAKSKIPFSMVQNVGRWNDSSITDEGEGDLDTQYVLGMGSNVASLFWACDEWILEFTIDVLQSIDGTPVVFSLSYGTSVLQQCQIAVDWCSYLNYNSDMYVARTDYELQKLASIGISVLVSSGDNGAVGRGNNGHSPLDPTRYCVLGGCQHTSTHCQALSLSMVKDEFVLECILPLGMDSDGCSAMMHSLDVPDLDGLFNFVQAKLQAAGARASWEVDVEGLPHLYSQDACTSIYYTERIDFSAFVLTGFVFNASAEHVNTTFVSEYPGVSQWITSIGATTILSMSQQEQVASLLNGGIITSGGGAALNQPMPLYQAQAVNAYLSALPASALPPQQMWSRNRRMTPDVSLSGERYVSVEALPNGTLVYALVSGTSASAPAFAGMLSLIIAERVRAGKAAGLGFLNPALYQAAVAKPSAFNDIVVGDNRCTSAYCCLYGWRAIAGWDAASGLGSVNFGNLLDYFLTLP